MIRIRDDSGGGPPGPHSHPADGPVVVTHASTTGQTPDDHHAEAHSHPAQGAVVVSHASTTGQTPDDHHPQAHTHPAEGVVVVTHASTTGQGPDDHHAEDHDHDGSPTQKLSQANTHESADTDTAPNAIHHTLGVGANQAAAGDHIHPGTSSFPLTNNGLVAIPPGAAVYASGNNAIQNALADNEITARVVGLSAALIAPTLSGDVVTGGLLTLTTLQWDAVTGGLGGLTFNTIYYLDETVPGRITATPPNDPLEWLTEVGLALSDSNMLVRPSSPKGL